MDENFSWPKKGDHPFSQVNASPNSPTFATLFWLSSINVDDSDLATAFKRSADMIIEQFYLGKQHEYPDIFFFPITYLYRHSFELKIKYIIKLATKLQLIENCEELVDINKKHGLHPLWNYAKRAIQAFWPKGSKEDIGAAERIIQEFHRIDKTGQNLRYSKDLAGKSTLSILPESAELKHIQNISDALFNFFEGCEAGLEEAIDCWNDETGSWMKDIKDITDW